MQEELKLKENLIEEDEILSLKHFIYLDKIKLHSYSSRATQPKLINVKIKPLSKTCLKLAVREEFHHLLNMTQSAFLTLPDHFLKPLRKFHHEYKAALY